MKSKRDLKKGIKYICSDLVGECMVLDLILPEDKHDELAQLVVDIALLQEQSLANCTFSFDKAARDFPSAHAYQQAKSQYVKAAFKVLHKQFNARLVELVHELNRIGGYTKAE